MSDVETVGTYFYNPRDPHEELRITSRRCETNAELDREVPVLRLGGRPWLKSRPEFKTVK